MPQEQGLLEQLAAAQAQIQDLKEQFATARETAQQLEQRVEQQRECLAQGEAQNHRLQRLLEASPATTYSYQADPPYTCTYISRNIETILGYSPAEFTAEPNFCVQHVHPDDAAQVLEVIPQLLTQGKLQRDYRVRHRDGHYVWIRDDMVLLRDAQGVPQEVVGYFTDITDRKTELQHRQRTEAVLQQQLGAIEAAVDGIAILQDEQYVYLNSAHGQFFGYETASELIGQSWKILYSPEMLVYFEQTVFPSLQQQKYWQGEAVATRKDGTTFPQFLSLTLLDDNMLVCICRDITQQKQVEDQLKKTQDKMMAILNELPAVVYTKDLLGRHTFVNKAFLELFGCESSAIIGKTNHEFFDFETANRIQVNDETLLAHGTAKPFEETVGVGDTQRTFISNKFLLYDSQEQPYAICGISTDISDRKQAELTLQYQKKFIESAIQTNPTLLVYLFDVPSRSMSFVSESVANLLDYTAAEILDMGPDLVPRLVHPDDHDRFAAYVDQLDQSQPGESLTFEYRVRHRDGRWLDLLLRGQVHRRDEQGHVQQFLGSVTDSTRYKRTEAHLQASEARFEAIANLVPDFLWESEPDGFNTWCNQRWLDYTGQTLEQSLGRGWLEAVHPEDRAPSVLIQRDAVETGEPRREERRIRRHDGEYRWFVSNVSPIKNAEGHVIKVYGSVIDVHEERMALEASQAAAAIDAFRVRLSDVLRSLTNPIHIQAEACHLLGDHLGVDRVFYVAFDEVAGTSHVYREYLRGDSASLLGECSVANYGWSLPYLRRGESVVIADTQATPILSEADQARLGAAQLMRILAIPLLEDGVLVGALVASESVAREWTAAEVDLVRETAERLWTTMQRAEAEAAVKDLSERLSLALQAGAIGTWDWDCVNEVNWDDQMYALYGLQDLRERAIYPTWRNSLHPDDRDRVEALLQAALRGAAVYDTEFRILRPTGELRWIQAVAEVQTDPQGNPIRVVGINQDITARKQTAIALQEQTDRLSLALESGAFGLWEWDLGENRVWDDRIYELYGLQNLGRFATSEDWLACIYPDDRDRLEADIQRSIAGLSPLNIDFRIVRPDGALRWLQSFAQVQRDAAGRPIGMVGITRDITEKKEAEAKLQLLADRLSLALLAGQIGFWLWDLDQSLFWDPSLCRIYGLSGSNQVTDWQTWRDLVHPEDVDEVEALLQAAIHGAPYLGTEFRIYRPDGELRWIQSSAHVQQDENGQPVQMIGVNQDITARKQAELALKEQTNRLTLALQAGAYGIWEWDLVGDPIWDERIYADYGLQDLGRPITYQDWRNRIHPGDLHWVEAQLEADLRASIPFSAEFRICRPDGELRWILTIAKLYCDGQGQPLRMVGIHQDITHRKLAEQEIQKSRAKFQRLVDDIGDKFVVFSHSGTVLTYVSGGLQSVFGVPPEAVLGQSWADTIQWFPESLDLARAEIEKLLTKQVPTQEFEMSFTRPDGAVRTIHAVQHSVLDEVGNLLAVEGVVEDITDRKAAEAELRRTNAELERATRLKDEFLANMSHELRTPLNAILGMTEGLQEEVFGPLTERQERSLDTIYRSSSHLLALINDILDLSKIEAGQIELDFSAIKVSQLCRASITFVKQQAHKKRQQINTLIPEGLPDLYGDDRRLHQVLINLLTNAVKFTPEGGHITLAASYTALSPDSAAQIRDVAHPQANPDETFGLLSISITDTGIGISPEDAQRLFQPFVQVNTALNRQYEGTGLGLALVKRIVDAHGGEITLTSDVGIGSCFTVRLPIIAMANADTFLGDFTTSIDATPSVDPANAPLILLAEDNEANISTTRSYLEAKGYRLIIARNGLEAINLATTAQPDLILMDIQMPRLDGLEAIRQIRQHPALATVPIIAITALAMPADQERCLAAGANHYLSKPIRLKQLAQVIPTFLADDSPP
ncbi:multi-sensor hybrid histidine kinase (plasmid) [Leptolyngbya sp. BL0902]|uniref:PAS domain-containing protein n=1 Tax=Leptolyngbya sp. BL0902 TaxID=1115757 RepID=UPI0018E8A7B8|nr:PAS domain-containing protein [Leptolyngbya sp. BL0902]QQE67410.1 multi-sensor hybrid histidine kinase [Leptolyngbya sp. BL0902]